jgi:hypothetical protein
MALKVSKAGEIAGEDILCASGDLPRMLTNFDETDEADGPQWKLPLVIGAGPAAREVVVDLPRFLSKGDYEASFHEPLLLDTDKEAKTLALFRGRFVLSSRKPLTPTERQELILRTKELVYREDNELASIQAYVANVEAAMEYRRSGPKRDPIADDVKLLVWARDGGACVRCGSKENLHFDHIIPVAKGGGGEAMNIQILCQRCNLQKSDKITF